MIETRTPLVVKLSRWPPVVLLGDLLITAVSLGMQMALAIMFLAGFLFGLEHAPVDAGMTGTVMFTLITLGGCALPFWVGLTFMSKAFNWWDRVRGVRAREAECTTTV